MSKRNGFIMLILLDSVFNGKIRTRIDVKE